MRSRAPRLRPSRRRAIHPSASTRGVLPGERLLAIGGVDRLCGRLLAHPRALQLTSLLIGALLVVLALRPLLAPVPVVSGTPGPGWAPARGTALPTAQAMGTNASEQAVLDVVAAYNQASIAAAALGRADVMAPYLASDGPAWSQVQVEYRRRLARGESHVPTLTRWGILRVVVEGEHATVETQEQWDDITSIGGQVVSSQRGILTRNVYALRRGTGAASWQIVSVTSTVVVG